MLLSIIIPIYNVEKYIRNTLSSIYDQNFDESKFEVIVVNDGTLDNSMSIVDEFSVHSNIVILNQVNQGLSCARNAGLRIARGDYIWFVDSDDMVTMDSLPFIENLVGTIDADIYAFDMLKINEKDGAEHVEPVILKRKYGSLYNRVASIEPFWKKIQICPAQRFVFSRKFTNQHELLFFPGIYHEDEEFCVRAMACANQIVLVNRAIYRYLVRSSGSITSEFKMKSVWSRLQIVKNFIELGTKEKKFYKKSVFFDRVFENIFWMLSNNPKVHSEYPAFIAENEDGLKRQMRTSFFKSIRYMSVGKIYKFVRYAIF